jgi:peptide/nickel transport system substrate-binding protein
MAGSIKQMQSSDIASLSNLAPVAKTQLERVGFKVDVQAKDWQTLVARRAKREVPSAGGWSAFTTSWSSLDILDPFAAAFLNASCDKATFGSPCDAELEKFTRGLRAGNRGEAKRSCRGRAATRRRGPTDIHLGQYGRC